MYPRVVHLSVCLSVCHTFLLVHPTKAVGRNEMAFGRDTHVALNNIVLNEGLYIVFARCQHLCRGDAAIAKLL